MKGTLVDLLKTLKAEETEMPIAKHKTQEGFTAFPVAASSIEVTSRADGTNDPELAVAKLNAEIGAYHKRLPQVWANMDKIRREARAVRFSKDHEVFWPRWCYIPFMVAEHWNPLGLDYDTNDTSRVRSIEGPRAAGRSLLLEAILYSAWRQTKGIYVFDRSLLGSLWSTPVNGKIPHDVITRLPEWATLVTLPPGAFMETCSPGERAIAALCMLSKVGQYTSLIFKIIFSSGMTGSLSIPLFETLKQSLDFIMTCITSEDGKGTTPDGGTIAFDKFDPGRDFGKIVYTQCAHDVEGLISALLYLCSEEPDVDKRVKPPAPVKTKKGMRVFPPNQHTVVNVGLRIGAALRREHVVRVPGEGTAEPGHHASPRPHIRAAHWHLFWTGPRSNPVARVKWLPPIAVNIKAGELEPVARPVGGGQ